MAKPHKQFSDALMYQSLSAVDEVFNCSSEAGPVKKSDGKYSFDTVVYRQRGTTKTFRITVEEING